ncbi:hypothetical protein GH714_041103 [Hevea brasiliensis]|uniref:Uncharacterized protein n=1 Tax=Hevea brasiliensis TaxID=3981 RepID=A0A6A6MW87_HEVBR|nr:hypothetical protein GH714_041103 [Hevea brasiliensis]
MHSMRAPSVTKRMCNSREKESELRRGPWTLEEDTLLTHYIARHGEGRWNMLANYAGLKRTGKSCRLRWLNYLKPDIKRGNLTPQEQLLILELHSKWGNRWSKIAQHLPGRTDNEIKNYWRTRVQRQARQLNIESNSKNFLDAVRCFWMPRLIQKVEQNCCSSPLPTLDSQTQAIASESSPNFTVANSFSSETCPPQNKLAQYSNLASENSSSVTSPNVLSTDFLPISHQPEIVENPASSCPPLLDNTVYNNLPLSDSYYVENSGYDMDGFNPAYMPEIDTFGDSTSECKMAEGNWVFDDDMAYTLWNMNDIWQF